MKILKSILGIFLALFLISNLNQEKADRLAGQSENVIHYCDHSECEEAIAALQHDLEEARKSCSLSLRIEIEFIPGFLGEWARLSFHSAPIQISRDAAAGLRIGDDLCQSMAADKGLMDSIIACRIIVADISPNQ